MINGLSTRQLGNLTDQFKLNCQTDSAGAFHPSLATEVPEILSSSSF
jgi:hypothetical protein